MARLLKHVRVRHAFAKATDGSNSGILESFGRELDLRYDLQRMMRRATKTPLRQGTQRKDAFDVRPV
jgi:hypothetical protein